MKNEKLNEINTGKLLPIIENKVLVCTSKNIYRTTEKNSKTATINNFEAFQNAFEYFNETLFNSSLPECFLNFNRGRRAVGIFYNNTWKKGENHLPEISLNPDFLSRKPIDVFSTLVHEMVHLWQAVYGKTGTGNYHNKQFSVQMEEVGLITSKTGFPGGERIGQPMSHYIKKGGHYSKVFKTMPKEFLFPWIDKNNLYDLSRLKKEPTTRAIKQRKATYFCDKCSSKVWGKPKLKIICGDCMKQMSRIL